MVISENRQSSSKKDDLCYLKNDSRILPNKLRYFCNYHSKIHQTSTEVYFLKKYHYLILTNLFQKHIKCNLSLRQIKLYFIISNRYYMTKTEHFFWQVGLGTLWNSLQKLMIDSRYLAERDNGRLFATRESFFVSYFLFLFVTGSPNNRSVTSALKCALFMWTKFSANTTFSIAARVRNNIA